MSSGTCVGWSSTSRILHALIADTLIKPIPLLVVGVMLRESRASDDSDHRVSWGIFVKRLCQVNSMVQVPFDIGAYYELSVQIT